MKSLILFTWTLLAPAAFAENLNQVFECQRTLTSSVPDQYNPEDGYFICDGTKRECYFAYKDGANFKFKIDEHPTYTVREINFDMTDKRQTMEHRLTTFTPPKSKDAAYVDIFWGENHRAFARNLMQANTNRLDKPPFEKTSSKDIEKLARKSIEDQLANIGVMAERQAGQPGVSLADSKKEWLARLSGCDWDKKAMRIKKLVADIK